MKKETLKHTNTNIVNTPRETVIQITGHCNSKCLICVENKCRKHIPVSVVKKLITDTLNNKIQAIRFTGGEPLLHPHIDTILNHAFTKKLYIILNTNATTIDNSNITQLKKANNLLISLQGFNTVSNDYLTGTSSDFTRKLSAIQSLSKTGQRIRIGTVISKTLIQNFAQYVRLLQKIGIRYWELYRPMISNPIDEFNISVSALKNLSKILYRFNQTNMTVKIANPIPFCINKDLSLSAAIMLGAKADDGHSRLVWDTRGYFKPSYFIDIPLGTAIHQAWNHPFLKKIHSLSFLHKICKQCKYLPQCKGGSRAHSYLIHGDYFCPDPAIPKTLLTSLTKNSVPSNKYAYRRISTSGSLRRN